MIGYLLRFLVTAIGLTLRWRIEDAGGILSRTPPDACIFAFWHNRIFLMPFLFRKHWSRRQREKVAVLVSASKDGAKLTSVLEKFDLICVRGSSSRRGREALRELTRLMADGYDVGITPDGPRGPRYQVQAGVISLAQLTQATVIPVTYNLAWKYTLKKAWDRFMIPVPFSRAVLRLGAPLRVPRDADEQQRENKRLELESILKTLSDV